VKVLVTGGAGFIGSHTVDALLKAGHDVRVLDSLIPPVHPDGRRPDYLGEEVDFVHGDVRDRNDMSDALQDIDVVFHMAAYQDYLTDFSTFAFVNDGGTALLYEIIVNRRLPVQKVILASSQGVYGEGKYVCEEHGEQYPSPRSLKQLEAGQWDIFCPVCGQVMTPVPSDESRVNPHNQSAISKYGQELYALTLGRQHSIDTVALRYAITQGPRQSFYNAYSGILRSFAVRLLTDLPPVIYEDGRQLRDYVHVGDVVRANLLVMESAEANGRVFNVGGREPTSVLDYARMVVRLAGKDILPEIAGEFRFGDARHSLSDSGRLRHLGWEPSTGLETIVEEYLEWAEAQNEVPFQYHSAASSVMRRTDVIRMVR
jgi:dTDP-L-rhamnose 4-epimerase